MTRDERNLYDDNELHCFTVDHRGEDRRCDKNVDNGGYASMRRFVKNISRGDAASFFPPSSPFFFSSELIF